MNRLITIELGELEAGSPRLKKCNDRPVFMAIYPHIKPYVFVDVGESATRLRRNEKEYDLIEHIWIEHSDRLKSWIHAHDQDRYCPQIKEIVSIPEKYLHSPGKWPKAKDE